MAYKQLDGGYYQDEQTGEMLTPQQVDVMRKYFPSGFQQAAPAAQAPATQGAPTPSPIAQDWNTLMTQMLGKLQQPAQYQGKTMTPQSPFPYFAGGQNLQLGFDPKYYLQQNPDVAAAVQSGQFTSPYQHYQLHGLGEGRSPYGGAVNWSQRGMGNMYRPRSFGGGMQQSGRGGGMQPGVGGGQLGGLLGLLAGRR